MDVPPPPEPDPYEPPQARLARAATWPTRLAEGIFGGFVLLVAGGVAFVATCLPLGGQIRGIGNRSAGSWVDWLPELGGVAVALAVVIWVGRFWFGPASSIRSTRRPPGG